MAGAGEGLAIEPGYDFRFHISNRAPKLAEGWAFAVDAPYFESGRLDANNVCCLGVGDEIHNGGLI